MSKEQVIEVLEGILHQINEVVATFPDDEPRGNPT